MENELTIIWNIIMRSWSIFFCILINMIMISENKNTETFINNYNNSSHNSDKESKECQSSGTNL